MITLSLILCLLTQTTKPAPMPGLPADAGVYFRQADQWQLLQPASMSEMKPKGMDQFLETDGLTSLDLTMDFQGPHAKIQIQTRVPVFYVRAVGSPKEALIVALSEKKDRRTIRTSSLDATADNRGGYKKDVMRHVSVTEYSDGSYSITPEQELKPGEYLVVFGPAVNGYDFGIKPDSGRRK